jgi:hypothetical protein
MPTKEIIFGNQKNFAIRYVSGYKYRDNPNWLYAHLHLILDGHLIGDIEESCSADTWLWSLKVMKDNLIENRFQHPEFKDRTDSELFELIKKANQDEEDFKPEYDYLPQLESSTWDVCCFNMDETTDAYSLILIEIDNNLKFIWEGWREPCPEEEIGKRYSITVDKQFVLKTMNECISYVEDDYNNYPSI